MLSAHIERGDVASLEAELKNGVDANEEIETVFGWMPPLLFACRMAHAFKKSTDALKAVELLVENGADLHFIHEDMGNCFNMIYHSNTLVKENFAYKITKYLLDKNLNIEDDTVSGLFQYPAAVALAKRYFKCVELFIEYGCDLTPRKLGIKEDVSDFIGKNYPEARPAIISAIIDRETNNQLKPTQICKSKKLRI